MGRLRDGKEMEISGGRKGRSLEGGKGDFWREEREKSGGRKGTFLEEGKGEV